MYSLSLSPCLSLSLSLSLSLPLFLPASLSVCLSLSLSLSLSLCLSVARPARTCARARPGPGGRRHTDASSSPPPSSTTAPPPPCGARRLGGAGGARRRGARRARDGARGGAVRVLCAVGWLVRGGASARRPAPLCSNGAGQWRSIGPLHPVGGLWDRSTTTASLRVRP